MPPGGCLRGAVAEGVDEGAAPRAAGEAGGLDECLGVSGGPQVASQGVPGGGRVPGEPVLLDHGTQAAAGKVAGDPAAGDLAPEEQGSAVVDAGDLSRWRRWPGALVCCREAGGAGQRGGLCAGEVRGGQCAGDICGVQVHGDRGRGGEDAGGDGLDGHSWSGARVGPGPAGHVREGDLGGAGAELHGGQVGDGVGLDFADAGAGDGGGGLVPGDLGVQQDVAELVGERSDGVGGRGVGPDADGAVAPGGESVGGGTMLTFDGEGFPAGQMGERGPGCVGVTGGEWSPEGRLAVVAVLQPGSPVLAAARIHLVGVGNCSC